MLMSSLWDFSGYWTSPKPLFDSGYSRVTDIVTKFNCLTGCQEPDGASFDPHQRRDGDRSQLASPN
jgi:hypothetical protein